jgi:glucokinase
MAIPMLKPEHLIQFGGTAPVEGKPIAVYGAGTGLGWRIWCMWISAG